MRRHRPAYFLLLFAVLKLVRCGLIADLDRCLLWLKTDGSSCQPSTFFSLQKFFGGATIAQSASLKKCCKDGTGCFSIDVDTPWECYFDLPDCMNVMKPTFYFYTPEGGDNKPQIIDFFNLNESVKNLETVEPVKEFFTVIHGFGASWPKDWQSDIKNGLVALNNNVLMAKWTGGSSENPSYWKAASNTRSMGAAVAIVIRALAAHRKVYLNQSTIVGFSLGAHVSGYAGSRLPGLRRIIGLDPAGPMFQCMNPKARLDPTDAKFVVVVHTNGDYFLMSGCGTLQQFGHMDIYVNGGVQQPNCKRGVPEVVADLASLNFGGLADNINNIKGPSCSHNRAPHLFFEMLKLAKKNESDQCDFRAFPCGSTAEWLQGHCFQCPDTGCPKISLYTDLSTFQNGMFFFNTLGDNKTHGQYCGRQLLITLVSSVTIKGKISLRIKGEQLQSSEILFQDMYDIIIASVEKRIVATVPWTLTTNKITEVTISYNRNRLIFTGGPVMWILDSLTLQDIDGSTITSDHGLTIRDSNPLTVPVS